VEGDPDILEADARRRGGFGAKPQGELL